MLIPIVESTAFNEITVFDQWTTYFVSFVIVLFFLKNLVKNKRNRRKNVPSNVREPVNQITSVLHIFVDLFLDQGIILGDD